ncbi:MAG: hypothetical protein KF833_23285 [Verrucomicrobiae bacterium]|nr:hypothetical protein [Verrucomicrobiae bacterium]
MSWYSFRPYVSVAQRRREAEQTARKMAGKGTPLNPVVVVGRTIACTFWGESWCDNLEAYSDYANRLPRGRTYVRNGSVIDLQVGTGTVRALVQGSSLYRIEIGIAALLPEIRRVGLSRARSSASTPSGCVGCRKAGSCARSTQYSWS